MLQIIDWNGERYVPWMPDGEGHYDHLHRYSFAKEFAKGKKVLDLACGEGYGSSILAEEAQEVIGIDIDDATIKHASSRYIKENLRFLKGSITNIPFKKKKIFDVIVCFEAIEHIEDHFGLMEEVKRVLKTGGIFLISTPNKVYTQQINYQSPFHKKELDFIELKSLLAKNFKYIFLYGQNVYPSSNIFPFHERFGPANDFTIDKVDNKFCFVSSDNKLPKCFIAIASDDSLDNLVFPRNSYLLDLSKILFRPEDSQISYLMELLREKGLTLSHIFNANALKIILMYYHLRNKIIPINTKRRLIAKIILMAIKEPKMIFKKLTRANLKKFFYYFNIVQPSVLERKLDRDMSGPSKLDNAGDVSERFDMQQEEGSESIQFVTSRDFERAEKPNEKAEVSLKVDNIRVIAFYLPQFHPIPENDLWWGKGFTDWANVIGARPNFFGHYQPHLPTDFGFYDLRVPEVREQQAALAQEHSIYGFCYHHYWFHGHRLLERPFNEVLKSGRPDFPFCLCWANENWTRRWDGAEHEILIAQEYSKEDDIAFIRDIIPALRDGRYIRINGKPLLLVYRVNLLPNPKRTAEIWRKECRTAGISDIYLCAAQSFDITDPRPYGFDAAVEFPPHGIFIPVINQTTQITNPSFKGLIYNYEDVVNFMKGKKCPRYTLFRTVMPSWDNTPRRQNASNIYLNATPDAYKEWLVHAIEYTGENLSVDERLIFINAWNEWGEGCHLEPDRKHGDAFLKATRDLLKTDGKT